MDLDDLDDLGFDTAAEVEPQPEEPDLDALDDLGIDTAAEAEPQPEPSALDGLDDFEADVAGTAEAPAEQTALDGLDDFGVDVAGGPEASPELGAVGGAGGALQADAARLVLDLSGADFAAAAATRAPRSPPRACTMRQESCGWLRTVSGFRT